MGLFLIFAVMCFICFVVIAGSLRPTSDQKALTKRIDLIGSQRLESRVIGSDVEQYLKTRKTGSFGWLETAVADLSLARALRLLILQANSKTTLGTLLAAGAACAFVAFCVAELTLGMLPVGLAAAAAGGFLPIVFLRMKRSKRLKKFNDSLADSIDMMSRSLRAGHSLPAAIGIVAEQATEPIRSEFAEVSRQQNFGLPLRDALNQLLDRVPSQDLRVVATGMLVQKDTGGNLAEVLDRIGAVIRDRVRIHGEIRTHTAQGRLTGWILCLLPVVMLLMINAINPGYSVPLFHTERGREILYVGLALEGVGALIIRKIIRGIEV